MRIVFNLATRLFSFEGFDTFATKGARLVFGEIQPAGTPLALGNMRSSVTLTVNGTEQLSWNRLTPYDKTTQARIWQQEMSWMPDDAVRLAVAVELAEGTISATHEFTAPRPAQPFASWTWNADAAMWIAPVPYPTDGADYLWNEGTGAWVLDD